MCLELKKSGFYSDTSSEDEAPQQPKSDRKEEAVIRPESDDEDFEVNIFKSDAPLKECK